MLSILGLSRTNNQQDAVRFAGIDVNVKKVLKDAWETKNVKVSSPVTIVHHHQPGP
jgi:hypothetical protein